MGNPQANIGCTTGWGVFSRQFDQLLTAHRAAWNSAPNPMFELDHLATACVAVAKQQPESSDVRSGDLSGTEPDRTIVQQTQELPKGR